MIPRAVLVPAASGLVVCALAATALLARPHRAHHATVATVVAARPADVRSISLRSGERRVTLDRRGDGAWDGPGGTPEPSAGLLATIEDQLLPLQAYKAVTTDATRPEFGLVTPDVILDVEEHTGRRFEVAFGAPSFSGGGYYVQRTDDPRLFLVPRQTVDNLRSLLLGRSFSSPNPVNDKLAQLGDEQEKGAAGPRIGPYLQQVLNAGARPPEGLE